MKYVKRKPNFFKLKDNDLITNIKNEYEKQYRIDRKDDFIIGDNNVLIKINAINDSNFESIFDTIKNQNKTWHICKIQGKSYLKIDI